MIIDWLTFSLFQNMSYNFSDLCSIDVFYLKSEVRPAWPLKLFKDQIGLQKLWEDTNFHQKLNSSTSLQDGFSHLKP